MSDNKGNSKDNLYRPPDNLDSELRQEIEDALGGLSIEDIIDSVTPAGPNQADPNVRKGKVVAIHGEDIFVDLGGKSQGLIPARAFDDEIPQPGDWIEVTVEGYNESEGLLMLSRKGAVSEADWGTLEEGQLIEGRVVAHNKGGLELDVNGIRAFMPASHVELYRVEDFAPYVNQRLRATVIEVSQADRKVVLSRRTLLELEAAQQREQLLNSLVEGQTVKGTVKTIMPYGAFVDIGGTDGLLHVKDMAHGRVEDPKTVVSEGQSLQLVVLKIDRQAGKIGLGLKQALPDPWQDVETSWPVGDLVSGRITKLAEFGAFVELQEGLEGLIPISELTFQRRIHHPQEIVSAGQIVQVRIMDVDPARHRITLSLKRTGDDPWTGASVRWPAGTITQGTVKRLADFGAFVELSPGVEGLAHISELSHQHVQSVGQAIREGQTVAVKVLECDEERRRISLSIKQAQTPHEQTVQAPSAPQRPAKCKKPLKGGLD